MKLYVSLFGRENYAWPRCLSENVVVTMVDDDLFPFWEKKDKVGFIQYAIAKKKTERGNKPNKQTASRWYGLIENTAYTAEDYWIHRDGDEIWWTISKPDGFDHIFEQPHGENPRHRVCVFRKPCIPWSNKNKSGASLRWSALHPKAKNILSTQSTQIALSDENKEYALLLLAGGDLSSWHESKEWRDALEKDGAGIGKVYNARERAIWRMIDTVKRNVAGANGQIVERVVKIKNLFISEDELKRIIDELIDDFDAICAISGIPLQFDGEETDKQFLCSLDRIDSSKHYERDNLQLVCRFINKWKSAEDDKEFRRLVEILKNS